MCVHLKALQPCGRKKLKYARALTFKNIEQDAHPEAWTHFKQVANIEKSQKRLHTGRLSSERSKLKVPHSH